MCYIPVEQIVMIIEAAKPESRWWMLVLVVVLVVVPVLIAWWLMRGEMKKIIADWIFIILVIAFICLVLATRCRAHTKENNWGYLNNSYPPHSKETRECFDKCLKATNYYATRNSNELVGCYTSICGCYIEEGTFDLHCYKDYPLKEQP